MLKLWVIFLVKVLCDFARKVILRVCVWVYIGGGWQLRDPGQVTGDHLASVPICNEEIIIGCSMGSCLRASEVLCAGHLVLILEPSRSSSRSWQRPWLWKWWWPDHCCWILAYPFLLSTLFNFLILTIESPPPFYLTHLHMMSFSPMMSFEFWSEQSELIGFSFTNFQPLNKHEEMVTLRHSVTCCRYIYILREGDRPKTSKKHKKIKGHQAGSDAAVLHG